MTIFALFRYKIVKGFTHDSIIFEIFSYLNKYTFMRLLILFIALFVTTSFLGQGDINKKDSKGRKQGEWVTYYENSTNIKYVGTFKDDIPVGKFKFYYPDGGLKGINEYRNNGKDSYAVMYHPNKKVMSFGKYVDKKKDSTWVYYDEDENLSLTENYTNGELDGKQITYYPKGEFDKQPRVLEITTYKNGLKHGDWAQYYKNGQKLSEGTYDIGDFVGKVIYYHSNGEKNHVHNYKNGVKHGFCYTYDKSGDEVGKVYYWKGRLLEGEVLDRHLERLKKKKAEERAVNKEEKEVGN